jgi:hypothetical protein
MNKTLFFGIMAAVVLSIGGCGNKQQQNYDDYRDTTEVDVIDKPTIYGVAANTTTGDTLKLVTDNGDTLVIDITKAHKDMKVIGKIQQGDRMVVVSDPNKKYGEIVINQNMLLGDWIMPDPIDGGTNVGISIKEGGVAESIEMTNITYRTWKIVDGQLEIISIREGGGQEEEVNYYDITKLTADSLSYKNDEDSYEYSRYKPRDEYGVDIELEQSSLEEFVYQD